MVHKRKTNNNALTPAEAILESISDGVFTVDPDWRISFFNRAAEEITGVPRREAIGQCCSEVFRSSMCGSSCPIINKIILILLLKRNNVWNEDAV